MYTKCKKERKRNKLAFSLVELLISLIIISCLVTVFAPVMTKKIRNKKLSVTNKITTNCSSLDSDCKLCSVVSGSKICVSCAKTCPSGKYLNLQTCKCVSCPSYCLTCNAQGCIICKKGYGLKTADKTCELCTPGKYSNGLAPCKNCPAGYFCTNGEKTLCASGSYSNSSAYACTSCPSGYYCENGIKTNCSIFGSGCLSCNNSACLECNGHVKNGICTPDCTIYGKECLSCDDNSGCLECLKPNKNYSVNGKNYCVVNLGSNYTSPHSTSGITIVWQGTTCDDTYCCWRNDSTGTARFVCNYAAAKKICADNKATLISLSQISALFLISYYQPNVAKEILRQANFCTRSSGGLIPTCPDGVKQCWTADGPYTCYYGIVWASPEANYMAVNEGKIGEFGIYSGVSVFDGMAVRCVPGN